MTRNQRIGLIVAAVVVAVVAFVIAGSAGDDDSGGQAAQTTETTSRPQSETGTDTTEEPHETVPAKPPVTRIQIEGGGLVGATRALRLEAVAHAEVRVDVAPVR